jgi:hypothetical protein
MCKYEMKLFLLYKHTDIKWNNNLYPITLNFWHTLNIAREGGCGIVGRGTTPQAGRLQVQFLKRGGVTGYLQLT